MMANRLSANPASIASLDTQIVFFCTWHPMASLFSLFLLLSTISFLLFSEPVLTLAREWQREHSSSLWNPAQLFAWVRPNDDAHLSGRWFAESKWSVELSERNCTSASHVNTYSIGSFSSSLVVIHQSTIMTRSLLQVSFGLSQMLFNGKRRVCHLVVITMYTVVASCSERIAENFVMLPITTLQYSFNLIRLIMGNSIRFLFFLHLQ